MPALQILCPVFPYHHHDPHNLEGFGLGPLSESFIRARRRQLADDDGICWPARCTCGIIIIIIIIRSIVMMMTLINHLHSSRSHFSVLLVTRQVCLQRYCRAQISTGVALSSHLVTKYPYGHIWYSYIFGRTHCCYALRKECVKLFSQIIIYVTRIANDHIHLITCIPPVSLSRTFSAVFLQTDWGYFWQPRDPNT